MLKNGPYLFGWPLVTEDNVFMFDLRGLRSCQSPFRPRAIYEVGGFSA